MPELAAGRVQAVATRIVVERERERMRFVSAEYWDIAATMDAGQQAEPRQFSARLVSVDGAKLATGRDFGPDGRLKNDDVLLLNEAEAQRLAQALTGAQLRVSSVEEKPYTRRPYASCTGTSTSPRSPGSTTARSRTRRKRTRRSARPGRPSAPPARWPRNSTRTPTSSTS